MNMRNALRFGFLAVLATMIASALALGATTTASLSGAIGDWEGKIDTGEAASPCRSCSKGPVSKQSADKKADAAVSPRPPLRRTKPLNRPAAGFDPYHRSRNHRHPRNPHAGNTHPNPRTSDRRNL
jgi:hypothetical protein